MTADVRRYQPPIDRGYEVVPLDCTTVKVAAVQMLKNKVDLENPRPGVCANVTHMLELCDRAADMGARLAVFNEFTLSGSAVKEDRAKILNGNSIVLPDGPEVTAIRAKARQRALYIAFANLWQEPQEWPGHFFNGGIIVGPTGDILLKHWKAYFGYPGIGMEYSTTVYDVQDEFIKRYGRDAVFPVLRTPIGNLAVGVCSETFSYSAEIARIYAMKGAEIYCRMYGGAGWLAWHGRLTNMPIGEAAQNMIWIVNSDSADADLTKADDVHNSNVASCMIIDPCGNVRVRANTIRESIWTYDIPIAEFREQPNPNAGCIVHAGPSNSFDFYNNRHLSPNYYRGGIRTDQIIQEYQQFPAQFPPNLLTKYQETHDGKLPPTYGAAREWYFQNQRWQSDYNEAGKNLCPTIDSTAYPLFPEK